MTTNTHLATCYTTYVILCLPNHVKIKKPKSQPWYDAECKAKQTEFYSQLNTFRTDSSSQNRVNMVRTRSQYKSLLRSKKIQYDDTQTKKLNQLKVNNAKEYWKLLKNASLKSQTSLLILVRHILNLLIVLILNSINLKTM